MIETYKLNSEVFVEGAPDPQNDYSALVRRLRLEMAASAYDAEDRGEPRTPWWGNSPSRPGTWVITTRVARDSSLSCNGGDYGCWTRIVQSHKYVSVKAEWTADWDVRDYGGFEEKYFVPSVDLPTLLTQVAREF